MPHGGFLSLDGKHKVNWNGYPVEPVGIVDASSTFQLEAMCIVSSESTEFYLWLLEVLLEYATQEFPMGDPFHFEGKLNFGESDSADAIGRAACTLSASTGWTWLNCFMHLIVCNLTRKGATLHVLLRTDEEREQIKSMLKALAMYAWVPVFEFVMEEFLRAVARDNPAFATGFVNEYYPQGAAFVTELMLADEEIPETAKVPDVADPDMFWKGRWCTTYALPFVPMTQAAIEGKNPDVPRRSTLHKREVVTSYIPTLTKYLRNEALSMQRQPEKQWQAVPVPENSDWRNAQLLGESFLLQCALRAQGTTVVLIPAEHYFNRVCEKLNVDPGSKNVSASGVANVQRAMAKQTSLFRRAVRDPKAALSGKSLVECMKVLSHFYLVEKLDTPVSEYIFYDCSCPRYRKKCKCKHVLARGVSEGDLKVLAEKSLAILKRKKQRGRPKKPTSAWERAAIQ
ncbi:hypothetical protein CYMTET_48928 [Cymbomonas tetramitiformis]|uniref:SWIM-type domain-containing protein n=1 Tax=Cymbomonas tetramitiformis TaxID=36881 RepID=A0AAE0BSW5_9CHLO|nr:hypothetical protein CYMTET_48928 [Cymbomonas tetramitiformis]